MRKTQGLKLVIILYFIILFLSPAIYLSVCNIFEAEVQSAIVTWAIAYILDSIALGCLFKFKFDLDIFEIAYIIILNFFPFLFFYILGIVSLNGIIFDANKIINFIYG